jgi:hypothetical protein
VNGVRTSRWASAYRYISRHEAVHNVRYLLHWHCPMSSTSNTTSATSNFKAIFDAALKDYTKRTGKDLCDLDHPLASKLDSCDSPDSILNIFQEQAKEFGEFRKGDTKLFKWLKPTVEVLHTISTNKVLGHSASSVNPATLSSFLPLTLSQGVSTCKGRLLRHPNPSIRAFLPPYLYPTPHHTQNC